MSVSDQTQKSLEEIGLAGYEIKAFTTLIKTGELTASNLSHQCGVAYSRIYDVLAELDKKRLGVIRYIKTDKIFCQIS